VRAIGVIKTPIRTKKNDSTEGIVRGIVVMPGNAKVFQKPRVSEHPVNRAGPNREIKFPIAIQNWGCTPLNMTAPQSWSALLCVPAYSVAPA
jgi:hypothetical protein